MDPNRARDHAARDMAVRRRARWARIDVVLAATALALFATGCGIHGLRREVVPASSVGGVPHERTTLRAHLRDGRLMVFTSWAMADHDRILRGRGQLLDVIRKPQLERDLEVAVDTVALFESDALTVPGPVAALTVMTGVGAAITMFCVSYPKACFGSCPTFYAWDGERQALVAEGFSSSVAPALEATDLDALDRVRPRAGRVTLTMLNEALETHVVRRADLVLAPRPADGRVVALPDGSLAQATTWRRPDAALGPEGNCLPALADRDGLERSSPADSTDLAARETIELRFDDAPRQPLGLVLTARQSLLSTYVFYQTLAWMGRSAPKWLASLGSASAPTKSRTLGVTSALGGVEVQVEREGRWIRAGEFRETGPLASDTRAIPIPAAGAGVPPSPNGSTPPAAAPLRVRLSLARGLWRLDRVALVTLGDTVAARVVAPTRVLRHGRRDPDALACLTQGHRPLVTLPGDTLELVYELPAGHEDDELFLRSRGYYLEWMRDAWIAEENPQRLARLFLEPRAALREMAPAYKRAEPALEATFWGSRYAR